MVIEIVCDECFFVVDMILGEFLVRNLFVYVVFYLIMEWLRIVDG